jgi:hypothetical protein
LLSERPGRIALSAFRMIGCARATVMQAFKGTMIYWLHIARAIDRVTLHRDRCSEVPSSVSSSDFWEGGWFDYPDKERALAAMEQAGTTDERKCTLCKP